MTQPTYVQLVFVGCWLPEEEPQGCKVSLSVVLLFSFGINVDDLPLLHVTLNILNRILYSLLSPTGALLYGEAP